MGAVRIPIIASLACVASLGACALDEDGDTPEDLGALGGKADKITTRNVTLRPHLSSGAPSRRTFTVTTGAAFRASVGYSPDGQTRIVVSDDSGDLADSGVTWQPTVVVPAASAARKVKIRIESSADAALPVRLHVATPEPRKLKIATFNIRWYGIGGDVDHPMAETRNPTLKAFVEEHLADADLVVFEEIVDPVMLQAEVVPAGWTCSTYENTRPMHQFVTGCLAPDLLLTREADDTNLGYEPVAMNTLRPALAGVVRDAATLAPLARLGGVHLKAMPDSTDRRIQQVTILADRLTELDARNEQLPLLLLGDFNAHRSTDTMHDKDDWTLIAETFDRYPELGLAHVDYAFENTYRDKDGKAFKLDHMYLSRASVEGVDVVGPCNLAWPADQAAITQHFDQISDHCPVIANVTLD
jgi:endonuclease/exonuclease/phosphatase family metal-dependent hydrolase